eukprot:SAG22_NODE_597_length_8708_cov_11.511209_5_plen_229_part_00
MSRSAYLQAPNCGKTGFTWLFDRFRTHSNPNSGLQVHSFCHRAASLKLLTRLEFGQVFYRSARAGAGVLCRRPPFGRSRGNQFFWREYHYSIADTSHVQNTLSTTSLKRSQKMAFVAVQRRVHSVTKYGSQLRASWSWIHSSESTLRSLLFGFCSSSSTFSLDSTVSIVSTPTSLIWAFNPALGVPSVASPHFIGHTWRSKGLVRLSVLAPWIISGPNRSLAITFCSG